MGNNKPPETPKPAPLTVDEQIAKVKKALKEGKPTGPTKTVYTHGKKFVVPQSMETEELLKAKFPKK